VFENRVLKELFRFQEEEEVIGGWGSCMMRIFVLCTHEILLG
jgi:hypothetical protein